MRGKALSPQEAKFLIDETYINSTFKIVYPSKETLKKTIEIAYLKGLRSARVFDVRLYVVAQEQRPTYFVTYNTEDFKSFGDITIKTPDEIV